MKKHITKTGRAISTGKVTKASLGVRSKARKQERPLPTSLQCHPKRLTPTPVHPGCRVRYRWLDFERHINNNFTNGDGLQSSGTYELQVNGTAVGYMNDIIDAWRWRAAALANGVNAEIII